MLKKIIAAILSLSMLTACSYAAFAFDFLPNQSDENVTLIVEVEGDPVLARKSAESIYSDDPQATQSKEEQIKTLKAEHMDVFSDIEKKVDSSAEEGFHYTMLFNGFSVTVKKSEVDDIKNLSGVKNVYISNEYEAPKPFMMNSGEYTNVPYANDLGYSGEGRAVAIIDSEFDVNHEFVSNAPETPLYDKTKINNILNTDGLNIEVSANQVYKSAKIPFAYDYGEKDADTYSLKEIHGSHVMGIAAGKNGVAKGTGEVFSGVAPEAQLILMKVSNEDGILQDDKIIAAIDDASKFKIDTINLSLGSDYLSSGENDVFNSVFKNARNAGIMISVSAGNSNRGLKDIPLTTSLIDYSPMGVSSISRGATTVASMNNNITEKYNSGTFELSEGNIVPFKFTGGDAAGSFGAFGGQSYKYEDCGYGQESDFAGKDLKGKIAIIRRKFVTFAEMSQRSMDAGAVAFVVVNTSDDYFIVRDNTLPVATVDLSDGDKLFNTDKKEFKINVSEGESTHNFQGGGISSFSSWGVTPSLEIEPDITTPGGDVYSSIPDDKYSFMSGTSMAAPHLTGMGAIMNQFYATDPFSNTAYNDLTGENKVKLFENIMMSSSDILRNEKNVAESPRNQGAGAINMKSFINASTFIQGSNGETKINLKELGENNELPISFTVKNLKKEDVTYTNVTTEVMTDGYIKNNDNENIIDKMVKLTVDNNTLPTTVTVPANDEITVSGVVTVNEEELKENAKIFDNGFFIDGYVVLSSDDESIVKSSVPFSGFYGDWYKQKCFDTTIYDEGGSSLSYAENPNFSGTFIANISKIHNKMLKAGTNLADQSIVNDYASVSPMVFDCISFYSQLYRAADELDLKIIDSNDKEVCSVTKNSVASKYLVNSIEIDGAENLKDGNYTIKVSAKCKGVYERDNYDDTLIIPLVVDSQKPVINDFSMNGDKISIKASDNDALMCAYITYDNEDGESNLEYIPFLENNTVEFDVSDIADLNSIEIGVFDYAYNQVCKKISEFSENITANMKNIIEDENSVFAVFELNNNTDSPISGTYALAFYSPEGILEGVDLLDCTIDKKNVVTFNVKGNMKNADTIKLMLFDKDNLKPLDTCKKFDY